MSLQKKFTFANISSRDEFLGFYRTFITIINKKLINNTKQGIERLSEYKHVLANILRSRYVARTPQFEARSPERLSHLPVTNQQRACIPRKLGFALCCHNNATGALIANPPNSAQPGGSLYDAPKLHPGPCSSVGVRPRRDTHTHRHTDARDYNTFCVVYDSRKM